MTKRGLLRRACKSRAFLITVAVAAVAQVVAAGTPATAAPGESLVCGWYNLYLSTPSTSPGVNSPWGALDAGEVVAITTATDPATGAGTYSVYGYDPTGSFLAIGPTTYAIGITATVTIPTGGSSLMWEVNSPSGGSMIWSTSCVGAPPAPPAPTPSISESDSGPAVIHQAIPIPDDGNCLGVGDAGISWSKGIEGGWGQSWQQWLHDGRGGPVCTRDLIYRPGPGQWAVAT